MGWFDIGGYFGFTDGAFTTHSYAASYNPEATFDFFLPSTWAGYLKMLRYANSAATAENPMNYNLLDEKTCVGFCVDTMNQAGFLPWTHISLSSFGDLADMLALPAAVKLPGYNTGKLPNTIFFSNQ